MATSSLASISPYRSVYFGSSRNMTPPRPTPSSRLGFSSKSSLEDTNYLEITKDWLKVLLPATLAAGALYQNGNLARQLGYMQKSMKNIAEASISQPLSPAQWLWKNTKGLFTSAVAAIPAAFYFQPKISQIGAGGEMSAEFPSQFNEAMDRFGTTVETTFNGITDTIDNSLTHLGGRVDNLRTAILNMANTTDQNSERVTATLNQFSSAINTTSTGLMNGFNNLVRVVNTNFAQIH